MLRKINNTQIAIAKKFNPAELGGASCQERAEVKSKKSKLRDGVFSTETKLIEMPHLNFR